VLPCPVINCQNLRTTHGMNQPPLRATKFLTATHPHSSRHLTHSKQRVVTFSNRDNSAHVANLAFAPLPIGHAPSTHSSRSIGRRVSNQQSPRLEHTATHRKQSTVPDSNRQFSHAPARRSAHAPAVAGAIQQSLLDHRYSRISITPPNSRGPLFSNFPLPFSGLHSRQLIKIHHFLIDRAAIRNGRK
jgi:hypothetical protein